jgi:hypothetical protein
MKRLKAELSHARRIVPADKLRVVRQAVIAPVTRSTA